MTERQQLEFSRCDVGCPLETLNIWHNQFTFHQPESEKDGYGSAMYCLFPPCLAFPYLVSDEK